MLLHFFLKSPNSRCPQSFHQWGGGCLVPLLLCPSCTGTHHTGESTHVCPQSRDLRINHCSIQRKPGPEQQNPGWPMCICNVLSSFLTPSFHPEPPLEQWETKAPSPGPSGPLPAALLFRRWESSCQQDQGLGGQGRKKNPPGMDAEFCQQSLIVTAFREKELQTVKIYILMSKTQDSLGEGGVLYTDGALHCSLQLFWTALVTPGPGIYFQSCGAVTLMLIPRDNPKAIWRRTLYFFIYKNWTEMVLFRKIMFNNVLLPWKNCNTRQVAQ